MSVPLSSIRKRLILLTLLASFCGSCGYPDKNSRPELYLAAASDLVRTLPELCQDFHRQTGTVCRISFGSSGILAQQIQHGAPFAVFLSADRQYVQQLAGAGKVTGQRRVYARGQLAIWSRDLPVTTLNDLATPQVTRIAMANPTHAPYGRAARQALERAGLWTKVQPKVVLAETIRHSMEMAESGNVEVAFTAASLLADRGHSFLVPAVLYDRLDQEAAVVQSGPDAERFLDYLGSEPAKQILTKFGFLLPK